MLYFVFLKLKKHGSVLWPCFFKVIPWHFYLMTFLKTTSQNYFTTISLTLKLFANNLFTLFLCKMLCRFETI